MRIRSALRRWSIIVAAVPFTSVACHREPAFAPPDVPGLPLTMSSLATGSLTTGAFTELGSFGHWTHIGDLSASGSVVVGHSATATFDGRAYRWTSEGGLTDLGTLGGASSLAIAASSDGSVVVGYSYNAANEARAFRWTADGGMQSLGPETMEAVDVSDDGLTVAGSGVAGRQRAFRWTSAGGIQDLGTLGGNGASSVALYISADGNTIAGYSVSSAGKRAFRWTPSQGMHDLGTPNGWTPELAALSVDGSTIIGSVYSDNSSGRRAFRWTNGGWEYLGTIGGDGAQDATGVSADGSIIVGVASNALMQRRGFRWTTASGMVELPSLGAGSAEARAISRDGRVIIGMSDAPPAPDPRQAPVRWTAGGTIIQEVGDGAASGSAWFTNHDGSVIAGYIRRAGIWRGAPDMPSTNQLPVAMIAGSAAIDEGASVTFDASGSSDTDGTIQGYEWDLGDGTFAYGAVTATRSFPQDGVYTIRLRVTDDDAAVAEQSRSVTVRNVAPSVQIPNGIELIRGEVLAAVGTFTDPGDDAWSAQVDYGDGAPGSQGPLAIVGKTFSLSHAYWVAGVFELEVAIGDGTGTGRATSTIIVHSHAQAVAALDQLVGGLLDARLSKPLSAKLRAAAASVHSERYPAALGQLDAFLNEIAAMRRSGRMSEEDAATLRAAAERIVHVFRTVSTG